MSGLIDLVSFPMFLCSGVFFSAARFPDALREVMIEGASLAWGVVCFGLAVRLFEWR